MQVLKLVFSLYITFLGLLPCQDSLAFVSNDTPASVHVETSDHEHRDSEDEDDCTPFCICACCGAILDVPPTLLSLAEVVPLPPTGATKPDFSHSWNPGIFVDGSWQPPRV